MNRISDARIRELYQLAVRQSEGIGERQIEENDKSLRSAVTSGLAGSIATTSRPGCPSPQDLLGVVEASGSEESRLRVIDHAMTCPACRADFILLINIRLAGNQIAFDEDAIAQSEHRPSSIPPLHNSPYRHSPYRRWSVWGGVAAASVALLLAVNIVRDKAESVDTATDVFRGGASQLRLIAPAQSQLLSWSAGSEEGVITFIWHRLESVADYHFEVLTPEGETIVSATTSDTTLSLAVAEIMESYNSITDATATAKEETAAATDGLRWWVGGRASDGGYERSEMRRINFR